MSRTDLKPGSFYWVIPVNDPDAEDPWESEPQPARYIGPIGDDETGSWHCLNVDGACDWPMKWVGPEIVAP